ncbi:MAG TPA: DNA polymerase III subunit gamma/tau [Candidatus Saccharimonadales bacterium]|nr:DNA polymerase III subunit gamma/tau [Candidatus Saccharimonadales bacterium]
MGQALYRKYRSRSLEELVGQEHITHTLARALKAGRISHAYLFTGPRGVGKTSVARILAHEINQLPYSDSQNLDIIEIDAASNRRIDDIRDLREKVFITPVATKYKVYIIDEVHMLTGESFNALLKTLEEPPAHVVFILATTEAHKLPATIVSRTQRFAFRLVSREKMVAHLREIADKEGLHITDEALSLIADHGEGTFRDSISLLDQLSHSSDKEIGADDVANTLGLAPQAQLEGLVDALVKADRTAISKQLTALSIQGANTSTLVGQLSKALAEAAQKQPHLYHVIDKLLDVPRAYNPDLKLLTVLMLSTNPAQPAIKAEVKNVPAVAAAPAPVTIAQAPVVRRQAPMQATAKPSASPKTTAEELAPIPSDKPLAQLDNADWHTFLDAVKKASPPLYSVVKQAQPSFNVAEQELMLTFKFQLHRKKLDDPKQKVALLHIMLAALGGAPAIKTDVSADATPPPPPPADPALASVAAIMGGGEVIDATAA